MESVSVFRRWKSLEELVVLFVDDPRLAQCEQISLLGTGYWKLCLVASCQSRKAINSCLPLPKMYYVDG